MIFSEFGKMMKMLMCVLIEYIIAKFQIYYFFTEIFLEFCRNCGKFQVLTGGQ